MSSGSVSPGITEGIAQRVDGGIDVAETIADSEEDVRDGLGEERLPTDDHCNLEGLSVILSTYSCKVSK